MDENTKKMIEALKSNSGAVQALFRSQDGRELLSMLTSHDRGASLQQAAQSAARGDTAQIVQMVNRVMQSPEGAALIDRINHSIPK